MKKNSILFLFLILFQISFAQEKLIHGKISANGNFAEGINVVNLVNEKATISDANGEFQILAKADDLLVLSSMNFEYKRKLIDEKDVELGKITIEMVPKVNQIDVVVIEDYQLNAVDLGILKKPAKQYTPAERKLRTATDMNFGVGFGVTFSLDPLINLMSGRTKKLKGEILVERRERLFKELNSLFEPEYFSEVLKIKTENIAGFQYAAIEDKQLVDAILIKNKTYSSLRLIQLAEKYKQLQANEN